MVYSSKILYRLILLSNIIAVIFWLLLNLFFREQNVVDLHSAEISNLQIILERRRAHPFLSEYARKIIVKNKQGVELAFNINQDSGGDARVNLCKSITNIIFVRDSIDSYYIYDKGSSIYVEPKHNEDNLCYHSIGNFDIDGKNGLKYTKE